MKAVLVTESDPLWKLWHIMGKAGWSVLSWISLNSVHKPSYIFLGILEDNESPDQIKMLQLSERECKNIESEMEWKGSDQVDLEQTWTELNSRLQRRLKTKKWELED
ncbi:hypothetical protein MLD38_012211 [Melastoma candidum]|uniref:Uncharacterized protein n=1 Tax=Melastoma candidum TaxID=119954 RepID=A0ACB9R5L2_9MYRT|nr:hypothetical protein MLD38_012211 [Melastoma candidum]